MNGSVAMNHESLRKNLTWWMAAAALLVGCGKVEPPPFRLNMTQMVSNETPTSPEYQQEIADVLGAMFGTPDEPYAVPEAGLDLSRLRMAAGAAWSDEKGTNHGLYRKHCVHCHGITGDGRGPTARFLNPYPRDYRQGVYKFKSTYNADRPTDDDLLRVLVNGVPGTAMPSFSLLPHSELEALVEYVKYLSIRGQLEVSLAAYVYDDLGEEAEVDENGDEKVDSEGNEITKRIPLDPVNDPEQREVVMELLAEIIEGWESSAEKVVIPSEDHIPADNRNAEEIAASVAQGRELFFGTRANCVKCHGPTALGDGQQDDQDSWNKAHKKFLQDMVNAGDQEGVHPGIVASRAEVVASIYTVRNAIPRNLRQGIYRGGRRRLDIFWRIYTGIAGTPMPATGPASPGAQGTLKEEEIWNIVDYVLSLPYETPSRPLKALPVNLEAVN
ncbi:MAG: cytochrome c [Planctomycetes bacterium]|nr:cytochrome c [Planctomycetota bacterium]